ncbi:MAG: SurA N-terminal domain-containing protein [Alphaproteobacteria bacterium]
MMQAIRGKAGSIIIKVLFGLLIVSFGLWGVSDYMFYQDRGVREAVIAEVGDEEIQSAELRRTLEPAVERMRAQFGGTVDMQLVKQLGVVDNVLGQLVDRSLLNQEAERLGLAVPDEVVRAAIYENPAFRGPDGQFDRRLFAQALMMNRLTEDQLVARMRQEIPRNDLLQAVTSGIQPPRPLVEALHRHRNEKRVADIVSLPASAVATVAQPSETELTQFYEANPELFRAPEYRGFLLASLSPADLKPETEIPEETLRHAYEDRKDAFQVPEQREIQQILAPTEETAKEATEALAAGSEFRDVAAAIGMDPSVIELGLLNRQEIPSELGDIAFELSLNQPSTPVKTPFGYHILRVVRIEPGKERSFEEVKPQLAAELQLREAADRIADIANEADDALAGGATLEDLQQKFGFKLTPVAASDQNGFDSSGAKIVLPIAPDEVLKTVFGTAQGETTRITDTPDGALYVARVDQVIPSAVRPLDEVRDKAITAWQVEQKQKEAAKQAEALTAAVTPAAPLATVAADKGLTVQSGVVLGRTPEPGQPFSSALWGKLFAAKPGEAVFVADESGGYAAQLKEIQVPQTIPEDEAARLTQQLTGEMRLDIAGQFTQGLRHRYPVEIKRDELDRMF